MVGSSQYVAKVAEILGAVKLGSEKAVHFEAGRTAMCALASTPPSAAVGWASGSLSSANVDRSGTPIGIQAIAQPPAAFSSPLVIQRSTASRTASRAVHYVTAA